MTELDVRLSAVETLAYTTSLLAQENRKRHTNTDSSLGNLCNLLDRLFATTTPSRQCCYEEHTDTQVGNFMYCLTTTQASFIFAAPSNEGVGICKSGDNACAGISPEWCNFEKQEVSKGCLMWLELNLQPQCMQLVFCYLLLYSIWHKVYL